MPTDFDNMNYAGFPAGGNKETTCDKNYIGYFDGIVKEIEVKQVVTNPKDLASTINGIGYSNVLNIIPCNSYDDCIIVVLYKEK